MTSVLDEKRRVVIPKEISEALGLTEGSVVAFRRAKGTVIVKKVEGTGDHLVDAMSWNPKRTGRPEAVREREVKRIWG